MVPINYETTDGANNIFCFTVLVDTITGTLYTDTTDALPARSLDRNQYYVVMYEYNTNNIFAIPMNENTSKSIIESFDNFFEQMKGRGYKPQFNVTDNQAAQAIKNYL